MGMPPSVTKVLVKKGKTTIQYTSNVDRVKYTLSELTRAALRDVGKYLTKEFRLAYYGQFKKRRGKVGKFTQYWVRKKDCDLQVGLKPNAFYGGFQEKGSSKTPALGLLTKVTQDNIAKIVEIESQYLSSLESEAAALAKINEEEYEGGSGGE
ncbi:hypothetical protein [Acetobacterium carbinolicum]|uniref:hypothetical protein n=1 Tax=Acetobacterium carbinolicum TaxID=52690 RepID=UPI0039C99618